VTRPPIADGGGVIAGNQIAAVGRWREVRSERADTVIDLGESVLLPGLINAHCHLDYTGMAGEFVPTKRFTDWIKDITTEKSAWGYSEFAESWLSGARMLLRHGVTTVADVEVAPELLPEVWDATPLRVLTFLEMTGVRSRRQPEAVLREVIQWIDSLPGGRQRMGLSPHAPYSIEPEGIKACADAVARHDLRLCMHLAETREEIRFLQYGDGPLREFLNRLDVLDERYECPGKRPLELAHDGGVLSPRTVLAHGNYVEDDELPLLAESGVHVAYCPRTHAAFGHEPHPYGRMLAAGINVCLGSDSLASNPSLSVLEEIRHLYQNDMGIEAVTLIAMATARGAAALGVAERTGSLEAGKDADLTVVPLDLRGPTDPLENILGSTLQPVATFVRGRRVA